ncbi:MAG: MBL fold metallo-hydrolase [Alphaproteobacteria bacterium]|nr:MBL fold metallo-hydrolase [Alphaproteobacteria bacterium]
MLRPTVQAFFDDATFTVSYLVSDPRSRHAAIIDPVLEFDARSGRTATRGADGILAAAAEQGLMVDWLLETHVHADHLTAAPYLSRRTGAPIAIGAGIVAVQRTFGPLFDARDLVPDGSQFGRLLADGERFTLGDVPVEVLHTPGHTPACATYAIGDALFVGDTLFMPDFGTARCDFPGGDAATLYRSIRRILSRPPDSRIFVGHDYKAPGRDAYAWETTVADERARNVHVHDGVDEAAFVAMRTERDRKLALPALILPAVQVNMRAGAFPPPEADGHVYLKLPVDRI